jgi:hypothetical protein
MSDFWGLPSEIDSGSSREVWIFRPNPVATRYFTWSKPQGISMIYILIIGSGGGGGGGGQTSYTTGGGGGGSSGVATFLYPASFLPHTLYVSVAIGGAGGAVETNGGDGDFSYVTLGPSTGSHYLLAKSGSSTPKGGKGGAGGTSGGAGGGAASTLSDTMVKAVAIWQGNIAGQDGAAGGNGGDGTDITLPTGTITSGGAGGGAVNPTGVSYLGGDITGSGAYVVTIPGGAVAGQCGSGGAVYWRPMLFTGGSGGAGYYGNTAGIGGKGGPGSGGGGGGAGTTGGKGGDGGDGLVAIIAW